MSENSNNIWNINWNYYCISKNLTKSENEAKEQFQNFLLENSKIKESLLQIKMNKGDAIIWKDNEVLHGRNSFIAKKNSDRFIWKCAVNFFFSKLKSKLTEKIIFGTMRMAEKKS